MVRINLRTVKNNKEKVMEYHGECVICKEEIIIKIPMAVIDEADYFPFEYSYIHGDPPHGILLYLDSSWNIRGLEKLLKVDVISPRAAASVSLGPKYRLKNKIKLNPMIIKLGIVSKKEYEIISNMKKDTLTLSELATLVKINVQELQAIVDRLVKKSIIEIVQD